MKIVWKPARRLLVEVQHGDVVSERWVWDVTAKLDEPGQLWWSMLFYEEPTPLLEAAERAWSIVERTLEASRKVVVKGSLGTIRLK